MKKLNDLSKLKALIVDGGAHISEVLVYGLGKLADTKKKGLAIDDSNVYFIHSQCSIVDEDVTDIDITIDLIKLTANISYNDGTPASYDSYRFTDLPITVRYEADETDFGTFYNLSLTVGTKDDPLPRRNAKVTAGN